MIANSDTLDFDKFILAQVYINGIFMLEEEEKYISFKINLKNFEDYKKENARRIKAEKLLIQPLHYIQFQYQNYLPFRNLLFLIHPY